MKIHRMQKIPIKYIVGLCQEYEPPSERCSRQDWIIHSVTLDTGNKVLWMEGINLNHNEPFFWGMECSRLRTHPLCWRYDLTNAKYYIGSHENTLRKLAVKDRRHRNGQLK